MIVQAWGSAAAIVAASILLGQGVRRAQALRRRPLPAGAAAPAVGFSILIVAAAIAIKLPGRAVTAAAVLLVLVLVAAWLVVRARPRLRLPAVPLSVGAISAVGASIPFIANGRVGVLGVSLDNDTWAHLTYAEALRSSLTRHLYGLPTGYPLGPHSVFAAVATGFGIRLDMALVGFQIATVVVTALLAANAFRGASGWRRVVGGVLGGLTYLVAAYYAEGAFKEQVMAMLLLGLVLQLEEVRGAIATRLSWSAVAPAAVIVAAGVYAYSYLAVAWFGLTVVIWVAAELIAHPRVLRSWRAELSRIWVPAVFGLALTAVLLAPELSRIITLFRTFGVSPAGTGAITASNVGNLPHPLSPYETLGIWTSVDFRLYPGHLFRAGALSAFALAVLALGVGRSLIRREFLLPAAVAACALIYWRSAQGQSPYVTAKALVIAAPVVMVTGLRGLLCPLRSGTGAALRVTRLAAVAVFAALAGYSSYQALRDEPAWPAESTNELLALDHITRGGTVLFLGNSDYAEWLFHDSRMSALGLSDNSLGQAAPNPAKPVVYGDQIDFDTVDPSVLNHFTWVVTSNSPYASQAPAGFELARRLRMYELWRRVATVSPRQTLEPPDAPGAVLNCQTAAGRELARGAGVAAVMTRPVVKPLTPIEPGATAVVGLSLSPGVWELSLQYVSAVPLEVTAVAAAPQVWTMPAYLDRPGPWFLAGPVVSTGRLIIVTVHADKPSPITGPLLNALLSGIVATRVPDTRSIVPLDRACGRYVDWYRR